MYLGGKWLTIAMPASGNALDVDLLQSSILEPVLRIADVRTDKRIDFVGGIRGTTSWSGSSTPVSSPWRFRCPIGRRLDAYCGCRWHHAAEINLVRTEAPRRIAVALDLEGLRA